MFVYNRRRTGTPDKLADIFPNLKYSSWDHEYGLNNNLYHTLESCTELVQQVFWPPLEATIKVPKNRATPKLMLKKKEFRDRCVQLFVNLK